MSSIEDVLSKLDDKTRKRYELASQKTVERIPYYSKGLTAATNGGMARRHLHVIYGNKSAGKSLHATQTIGQAQREGLTAAIIDSEGTYDPEFGARLGVDNSNLILVSDKSYETANRSAVDLLKAGVDILVIDTYSQLIPEGFLTDTGETKDVSGQKQIGANARSAGVLVSNIHYNNEKTAVILISQVRNVLGAMHASESFTGGKAVEHAASQIVKLTGSKSDAKQIKGSIHIGSKVIESNIGVPIACFVEKNKLGSPFGRCSYDMYYAGSAPGIDLIGELVDQSELYGVISKSGAWVYMPSLGPEAKWNGRTKLVAALKSDESLLESLTDEYQLAVNGGEL